MPKRRRALHEVGGNAGAGGGAYGGDFFPENRGVESPIMSSYVMQYSSSRHRNETMQVSFFSPQRAHVTSESGNIYAVTFNEDGSAACTCPDYRYRRRNCRHIEGAMRVRDGIEGIITEETVNAPFGSEYDPEVSRGAAVAGTYSESSPLYGNNLAQQIPEDLFADIPDSVFPSTDPSENVSLTENEEVFRDFLQKAQQDTNIPYEYENVLGGSQNTFGIEIEFIGGNRTAMANELFEKGLIPRPYRAEYHSSDRVPGMWSFENDSSVDGEIVSPVFKDTPEAWRQIEEVCEIIKRHGGRVRSSSDSRSVGGHIHIGCDPVDHDNIRLRNLAKLFHDNEDLLLRLASGGDSGGQHRTKRTHNGDRYCRSISNFFRIRSRETVPNATSDDRYYAINFRPSTRTIEFRIFDGSLNPKQIQTNIKIANAMVCAAGRMEEPAEGILGNATYGQIRGSRVEQEEVTHSSIRYFLDKIFTRASDKLSALWLYNSGRWQSTV